MSKQSFHCSICDRVYKRERTRDKHELICKMMSRSELDIEDDNELSELMPSQREMFTVMNALLKEYHKKNKKLKELTKWCKIKKKKLNILDWLYANYTPDTNFRTLIESIELEMDDLQIILNSNLVDGLFKIIQTVLLEYNEKRCPIKAFDQNKNKLFIYIRNSWKPLNDEELDWFIDVLRTQIVGLFNDWNKQNLTQMKKTEAQELYIENLTKIVGKKKQTKEQINSHIEQKIYNQIKLNLSNVVEYEFTKD